MVFVGTNNEGLRDPKITGDKGVLMAFRESDGAFMWQMVHDKLAAGRVNDWPYQGVASSPFVEGDRVYYVSNRAELVCLDTQGFRDKENDGPVTDEKLTGEFNGDVVWKFDMIEEVGALPHNLANSSPVAHGDLDLHQYVKRPGRESRQRSLAESRRQSSPSTRKPANSFGKTIRSTKDSARTVGVANRRNDRRRGPGRSRPGRWLDSRV